MLVPWCREKALDRKEQSSRRKVDLSFTGSDVGTGSKAGKVRVVPKGKEGKSRLPESCSGKLARKFPEVLQRVWFALKKSK